MKRLTLVILAIALTGAPLLAHDMWIEPMTFAPEAGDIVGLKLRVGQDFLGDPIPRDPALINQFIVEDGEGRKPVVGRSGADPAGFVRAVTPGLMVVGYRSNPSTVDETAAKFDQYLREEGLDAVAALRASRGHTGGVKEVFARCAKSLLRSGPVSHLQGDHALGFTLELVAERNPYAMQAGQELPVRLTYENQPLAGALVVAINRANPAQKLSARSGKDGRVRFKLPRGGVWMIKAVHMIDAPANVDADWASYWASLTFELKQS